MKVRSSALPVCYLCGILAAAASPTLTERTLYLNSYAHCGAPSSDVNRVPYNNVEEGTVYNIKDETSLKANTRAWRECEIVLRSARSDGRLCVLQRQLKFDLCHVRLELYDGWANVDGVVAPNKTADCDKGLMSVEWCTSDRYLTIGTKKTGSKPDVKHIHIDLLVYDMRSPHRKAYMDSLPYCGSTYELDSSRVTVSNLDHDREVKNIFPLCALNFEYVGQDVNRSLCMVFASNARNGPNCGMNYTLTVFEIVQDNVTGYMREVIRHEHSCGKPSPVRWCATSNRIRLALKREDPLGETSVEPYGVFTALVMDHAGGPENLPFIEDKSVEEDTQNIQISIIVTVVVVVLFVCCVVVCLVIFIRRRRQPARRHRPVPGTDSVRNDADGMPNGADSMTNGNANGHCRDSANDEYDGML